MDVMATLIVILYHGRDRLRKNVLSVADIWLRKAIKLYVLMRHAAM